jgi:hypothetical protein
MTTLILPATGFELQVPDNFHYHDDGIVRSIALHYKKLLKGYGVSKDLSEISFEPGISFEEQLSGERSIIGKGKSRKKDNKPLTGGRYVYFYHGRKYSSLLRAANSGREVNFHIFVLRGLNRINTTIVKGHEEGHLVEELKREDLIEEGWRSYGFGTKGFKDLPLEAKCDISGLCACLRKYGPPNNWEDFNFNIHIEGEIDYFIRNNTPWRIKWK